MSRFQRVPIEQFYFSDFFSGGAKSQWFKSPVSLFELPFIEGQSSHFQTNCNDHHPKRLWEMRATPPFITSATLRVLPNKPFNCFLKQLKPEWIGTCWYPQNPMGFETGVPVQMGSGKTIQILGQIQKIVDIHTPHQPMVIENDLDPIFISDVSRRWELMVTGNSSNVHNLGHQSPPVAQVLQETHSFSCPKNPSRLLVIDHLDHLDHSVAATKRNLDEPGNTGVNFHREPAGRGPQDSVQLVYKWLNNGLW